MTKPLLRSMLAKLLYGAECAWLTVSCAGWALLSVVQMPYARHLERQLSRLKKESDVAEAEYEAVRAAVAAKKRAAT